MAVLASFHACSRFDELEQALTAASLNPSTRFSYFSFAFRKLTSASFCLVVALMPMDAAAPRSLRNPMVFYSPLLSLSPNPPMDGVWEAC